MSVAIDILHLFPTIAAIDHAQLQRYCEEWASRPIAREFGVAQLIVDEHKLLRLNLDQSVAQMAGARVFIPIDELLGYIIDQHFSEASDRQRLHAAVREARKNWGELGRDYEVTAGRLGTLYIVCKACRAILELEQQAHEGQTIQCPDCEMTCPLCGATNTYCAADLQLRID